MATLLTRHRKATWFGWLGGALLAVLVGQALLWSPMHLGDELARLSYDLPFPWARHRVPPELTMVYLDTRIKTNLGQPTDQPLARRFYTQLLERLTHQGARLVLFDILFDNPDADPKVDAAFAEAIRKHGRVVLVGYKVKQFQGDVVTTVEAPPISPLQEAAAGWGLAEISQDPADHAVRRLDTGDKELPSAGWVGASLLKARVTEQPGSRLEQRWLNYYCEPAQLKAVNFDHALGDGLPGDFFRDKIVIVGGRPGGGIAGAEREEFASPFTRFDGSMASGPSVHAFTVLNLQRGDWINRVSFGRQALLAAGWGIFIAVLLMQFRPWPAVAIALLCSGTLAASAIYVQLRYQTWFSWLVPAAGQTSVALLWSVGFQYLIERRRQQKLKRAFGVYYSPYMADRIANSDFDLKLGGKEVDATIMFTDLEGFTAMSETLPPAQVSALLTAYFTETTRAIFEQHGMIIKFIGDSVMAVWGAPLAEPLPAERAVLAAIGMRQRGRQKFEGRTLRTRIGINSGKVLAGNLGSEYRFDYTLIGEATNFASRLEGLNKYLGTDILISETTRRQISGKIMVRDLGQFIVAGKTKAVNVHEVLGETSEFQSPPPWLALFAQALTKFASRDFEEAEKLFREVIDQRAGKDGPSEFYLKEIAKARLTSAEASWDGSVALESK